MLFDLRSQVAGAAIRPATVLARAVNSETVSGLTSGTISGGDVLSFESERHGAHLTRTRNLDSSVAGRYLKRADNVARRTRPADPI
jgi:hypothetical protein